MIRGSSIIECVCEPEVVIKRVYYTPVLRIAREMNFKKENQIYIYMMCTKYIISIMMLSIIVSYNVCKLKKYGSYKPKKRNKI